MKLSDFTFAPPAAPTAPAASTASAAAGPAPFSTPFPTMTALLEAVLPRHPERLAVRDAAGGMTYAELDGFSARLARFLRSLGVGPERFVGVMLGRRALTVAAILGVLRAGGAYVPVDPTLPRARRRDMLVDCAAPVLLTERAFLADAGTLLWRCPDLAHLVVLDAPDAEALREPPGELMSEALWDFVAEDGADDIQVGGWKSPYTGQWLSREVMEGYGANVAAKLAPVLGPGSRVLEIGVASGITMRHVAPLCGRFLGVDLSGRSVAWADRQARQLGLTNCELRRLRADEIGTLPAEGFDCVICNSVIESFPGLGYLRRVLDLCLERLAPGGRLFLGNIWDLERLDELAASLRDFARIHAGQGYATRLDMDDALFVHRDFLRSWAADQAAAGRPLDLAFSPMDCDERELAAYGYDLMVGPAGPGKTDPAPVPAKRAWTLADMAGLPATPPDPEVGPENAAYAVFTSGTTGRPKGAVNEQRNLANLAQGATQPLLARLLRPGEPPDTPLNITLIASFAFDASVQQIFSALAGGHTLHIVPDTIRRDPARLHAFLEERDIHLCDGTASHLAMLLDHWERSGTHSRARCFLLGGEVMRPELPRRFFSLPGHDRTLLVNAYGPTECAVDTTMHGLTSANWREYPDIVPIGEPVAGMAILVCDEQGRELPAGVPGELLLAGPSVGRGYLNAPELTARRFSERDGRRVYRSGDLGRRRADGLYEFLRREDAQVKVRGYRIECGEIEAALLEHPGVGQAVVAAGDWLGDGSAALAAWFTAREAGVDVAALRDDLHHRLPEYMVPSHFVPLERLPLTHSGKVDRRALPSPVATGPEATGPGAGTGRAGPGRAPETPTERRLAPIWAELLKLARVDAEADFFEQGGHSVLAVRLVGRIEEETGARLPLDRLFAEASLAAVAREVDRLLTGRPEDAPAWSPLVPAREQGDLPPLVCFHPVGGNILCYQHLAQALGPDQPVHMIQSFGLEPGQAPLSSVEDMAERYVDALTTRFPDQPLALAGWSFGGVAAWEAAHRLLARGRRVSALALLDSVAVPERIARLMNTDEAQYLATLFADVLPLDAERLRGLDHDGRLDLLLDQGRARGVFPADMDRGQLRRLLDLFYANGLAATRYRPRPLDLAVLLVRPEEDSETALALPDDPLQGWGALARGGVRLVTVPGNHTTMLQRPYVERVAGALGPWLRAAAGAASAGEAHRA
ncbi:MAG: alpha/beta fold hydrolase [Desulfovibrionaceae bacterium]